MRKSFSTVLLAVGIVLLLLGIDAYQSANSVISRFFNGEPLDRAIWLLLGGAVACAGGLSGLVRK